MYAPSRAEILQIEKHARLYKERLSSCRLMFVFGLRPALLSCLEVEFLPKHFMHLVGCRPVKGVSSEQCFRDAVKGRLSPGQFCISRKEDYLDKDSVFRKVAINIDKSASIVVDFNGSLYFRTDADKLIGSYDSGALGIRFDADCYIPYTLLKDRDGSVFSQCENRHNIYAVFKRGIGESSYRLCTRLAGSVSLASDSLRSILDSYVDVPNLHATFELRGKEEYLADHQKRLSKLGQRS